MSFQKTSAVEAWFSWLTPIQLKTLILRIFMKCELDVLYTIQNKIAEFPVIEDKILATNLEINECQNGEHNLNT